MSTNRSTPNAFRTTSDAATPAPLPRGVAEVAALFRVSIFQIASAIFPFMTVSKKVSSPESTEAMWSSERSFQVTGLSFPGVWLNQDQDPGYTFEVAGPLLLPIAHPRHTEGGYAPIPCAVAVGLAFADQDVARLPGILQPVEAV